MIVNNEMIEYQQDLAFIPKAEAVLGSLRAECRYGNKKLDDKHELIEELETIFKERFGVYFIIGHSDSSNAYCIPVSKSMKMDNNRYVNWRQSEKNLESVVISDMKMSPTMLKRMRKDEGMAFWKGLSDSNLDSYLKAMKDNGLVLDLHKAKVIIDLDKTPVYWYLNIDFFFFMWEKDLTPREVLAVIMHEIGHCWTYIEYSYKLFGYTQTLSDVIREEYSRKNKSLSETMAIYYKEVGLKDPPNTNNPIKVAIKLHEDITVGTSITYNHNHGTDFERWADEFATRMGLGKDLQKALDRFEYERFELNQQVFVLKIINLFTWSLFTILTLVLSAGALVALGGFAFLVSLIDLFYVRTGGGFFSRYTMIYDERDVRAKKTRNSLVRQLRITEDPVVRENILADIEACDEIVNAYNKYKKNTPFHNLFLKYAKGKALDEINLTELLEDLNSNGLHVGYNKLLEYKDKLKG